MNKSFQEGRQEKWEETMHGPQANSAEPSGFRSKLKSKKSSQIVVVGGYVRATGESWNSADLYELQYILN